MKMEASSLKLQSAKSATDAGGLTFGPAWLRQLSSGDTNKNALPPSPGLAFQSSKHRYSREEMLAIYESIEKSLFQRSPPNLAEEFEELHKKDLQRPVLLTPPSLEEQKFLSTCVNSQVVLNSYNKIQGQPGSANSATNSNGSISGSRNGEGGSRGDSRGGSNSMRGSRGGGRGGINSERGRGRGGRGGSIRGGHDSQFKTIDEEGNQIIIQTNSSNRGGSNSRGGSTSGSYKGSYSRGAWDERDQNRDSNSSGSINGEKRYSKAMAEDNWRNRAAAAEESDGSSDSKQVNSGQVDDHSNKNDTNNENENNSNNTPSSNWRNSNEKNNSTSSSTPGSHREWPSSRNYNQVASSSYSSATDRNRENFNSTSKTTAKVETRQPEWLDDDDEENTMTFDNSGKFISVKELNKNKTTSKETEAKNTSDKAGETNSQAENENKNRKSMEKKPEAEPKQESENESDDIEKNQIADSLPNKSEDSKSNWEQNSSISKLTAQLDENLTNQKLNSMSLNELHESLLSKKSNSQLINQNSGNQPSFENLQAIHQNLQQQQLKLKNEMLLASLNTDPKRGAVPSDHQDAERWFYLDPQNEIQGSFSSEQMAGWFAAGYFTMSLMIKRGRDEKFSPLGVVSSNWGRIPFTSGPQPQQFSASPQPQAQQPSQSQQSQPQSQSQQQNQQPQQNWSKEQIIQQMQLFQRFQQMQLMPQNINLLRNELIGQQQSNISMSNLGGVMQQLQQLQLQQNSALAAAVNLGPANASQIIQDIRSQQEALISQFASNNAASSNNNNSNVNNGNNNINNLHQSLMNKQHQSSLPDLDPAILGAAPSKSQSIWGDLSGSRQSPITTTQSLNPTPPPIQHSISPINNIHQQANSNSSSSTSLNNVNNPLGQFISQNNLDTNLLAQQIRDFNNVNNANPGNSNNANSMLNMMMNDNNIKDKIQRLFDQTKQDEERRRKQEEYQLKLKRDEEEKRRILMEEKLSKEKELKRQQEEEKVREEMRKEQQRKKLAEIIIKQEEEKKKHDEMKKKKEEENKLKQKEEKLKQKQREEQKRIELAEAEKKLQEEAEKRRQEHYAEALRKQAEAEKQKLRQQQEQLNNLQLPAHANWAKQQNNNQQQQQQQQLKSILEQQALESMQQRLLEQQKQAEMMAMQQSNQSSWSSLFRGNAQALPTSNLGSPPLAKETKELGAVSLASIQAEQIKKDPVKPAATMSAKIQQNSGPAPAAQKAHQVNNTKSNQSTSAWGSNNNSAAAWGNNSSSSSSSSTKHTTHSSHNDNSGGGFWTDIGDKKSSRNSNHKANKNQFPDLGNNSNNNNNNHHADMQNNKNAKKMAAIEESMQQIFLRNMTISDEFMKWCHEQLNDFHVELHIPTFVNFLREIESCNEIEEYVVNYLGESQHAKDFAHQFYINRESQIKQQNNLTDEQVEESTYSKESQFSKKQKKRSKGQRVDHQLLGFTVQPDPNLKNRGDIDPL